MRLWSLILIASLLSGCGTLMTQLPQFNRQFKKVKCGDDAPHYVPRIYSGTTLDVWAVITNPPGQVGAFLLLDLPFSLAADTVLLPYTAVRQVQSGSYRCQPKQGSQGP
jgi:uncharacterized protein YceK